MLQSFGYSDSYIQNFNEELKNLFFELVVSHTFNFYASQNSQEKIDALETLMHKAKVEGKFEDQKQIMEILKDTMLKYPELSEQLLDLQRDLEKNLLMNFLKTAEEDKQIEIFTYLIQKKNEIEEKRKILDNRKIGKITA